MGKPGVYPESLEEPLMKKYSAFRELLSQNNAVLEAMAELENSLSGDSVPERQDIRQRLSMITVGVDNIIIGLNLIAKDKFLTLHDKFKTINSEIEMILSERKEIPVSEITIPFDEITRGRMVEVGNKNANLGEVKNRMEIPIPEGFAVSTFAFKKFMEHNKLLTEMQNLLSEIYSGAAGLPYNRIEVLKQSIIRAEIPADIEKELDEAYQRLCGKCGRSVNVAVRSSAVHEDGAMSFAGQFATFLNVSSHQISQKYKEVVSSLLTGKVLFYYRTRLFQDYEIAMAVGVMEMIEAVSAGVVYTRNPNNPGDEFIIVSAVYGMGHPVVEGLVTPATYILSRHPPYDVISSGIPEQTNMFVCGDDGTMQEVPLPHDVKRRPCLSEEHLKTLAGYAISIENHYSCPQDIEWALDISGKLYVLQTRPLVIHAASITKPEISLPADRRILMNKGVTASKGVGYGKACLMNISDDMERFPEGAVLVTKYTSTRFVPLLERTSAIVTDIGSATMHMATVAREFGVPAIVGTGIATELIKDGQDLTVDATNCTVYEGFMGELVGISEKRKTPARCTPIFDVLHTIRALVVPLTLVNPDDETFKPEYCRTLHDITRFAHQKAMHEMFKITKEYPEDAETVRLHAGIPISIEIIDLDKSIEPVYKKLAPEHIHSLPFNAFLKGLTSLPWPEPRHVDVKGFLGMVAHTASIAEHELGHMGERSFAFISKEYMNFSVRLGYHLSVVEAYAGDVINDNYIRFFFSGGGADSARRLRRVHLITEVLKRLGFYVKSTGDLIDALLTKDTGSNIEVKLGLLGKLTVYTKQLDVIMYDDQAAQKYLEEFISTLSEDVKA